MQKFERLKFQEDLVKSTGDPGGKGLGFNLIILTSKYTNVQII